MDAQDSWLVAGWATLHLLGLVAAWTSRWPLGRIAERLSQAVLLGAFLAIAGLAVTHTATSFQVSLLSATTMAVMAVGAICDVRTPSEDQVISRVVAAYE